ncbi:MAG: F0F1 ATP synthase subunit delta [Candidatus Paceibacterota bacterium]
MAKISTKNIVSAIHEMTKGKEGHELNMAIQNITDYLAKKRMIPRAGEILKKLEETINKEEGIVKANITYKNIPTKKISEEIEEILKNRYNAKKILATTNENEDMLGGVKIEVGDEVIDLTLKNKINQLQNYLITN